MSHFTPAADLHGRAVGCLTGSGLTAGWDGGPFLTGSADDVERAVLELLDVVEDGPPPGHVLIRVTTHDGTTGTVTVPADGDATWQVQVAHVLGLLTGEEAP